MKIKQVLNEMPMGRSKESGPYNNPPEGFEWGKPIRGNMLRRGMKVAASYNRFNHGTDFVEILGVTDNSQQYGKSGVKYNSVREALQASNVRSLKALEELDDKNEYGYGHYLCVRDLTRDESGCWYYLYEGRWARGSGAEALSFRLLTQVPVKSKEQRDDYIADLNQQERDTRLYRGLK